MKLPIIFFHTGYQEYLELCLRQAALKNEVILIGNAANAHLGQLNNVSHYMMTDFPEQVQQFLDNYVHLHPGGKVFEILCFVRWIVTRNVMKKYGINNVFYSDSDNLIYSDLEKVYEQHGRPKFSLAVPQEQLPYRHQATGAVSYWDFDTLNEFCYFIIECYTNPKKFALLEEKWNWHHKSGVGGGICDMVVLWHFLKDREHEVITRVMPDKTTFNININEPTNYYYSKPEYEMQNEQIKKIVFKDNMPYCKNILSGENVMFHNLQFQGLAAKSLVKDYVRGL